MCVNIYDKIIVMVIVVFEMVFSICVCMDSVIIFVLRIFMKKVKMFLYFVNCLFDWIGLWFI